MEGWERDETMIEDGREDARGKRVRTSIGRERKEGEKGIGGDGKAKSNKSSEI